MSSKGSGIGTAIGAAAGSFIPGIGTLLGGSLGGALGGLFGGGDGPTPQEQQATAYRQQAADAANHQYQDTGYLRTMGQNKLMGANAPDLSGVYGGGPQYSSVNSPLLTQANGAQGTLLNSLTSGPDYLAQAKGALSDFDANEGNVLNKQYRQLGQKNAAMGRLGSGMASEDNSQALADATVQRKTLSNDLIRQALTQGQQDKYANLTAAGGVSDRAYGQGAGERANEQGVAQQGVLNRANQYGAEQGTQAQQFGQGYSLAGLGNSFSPAGVLLAAGGGAQGAGQFQAGQNDQNANDVASLFGTAGALLGRRGKSASMAPQGMTE